MATSPHCTKCQKQLPTLPGVPQTACRDLEACARRAVMLPPPPAPPPPCRAQPPSQEEVVVAVAEGQRSLAMRALRVTNAVMDKMEHQLEHGVESVLKDGTVVVQPIAPMALSSMLRELRPVVQEPVRVKEINEGISPPITLNTNNPEVVRAVVKALAEHRAQKIQAAKQLTMEVEVTSSVTIDTPPALEPHSGESN